MGCGFKWGNRENYISITISLARKLKFFTQIDSSYYYYYRLLMIIITIIIINEKKNFFDLMNDQKTDDIKT